MPKVTKALAAKLAKKVTPFAYEGDDISERWCHVREQVDALTGSDLDCTQLDLLTDWVTEALPSRVDY